MTPTYTNTMRLEALRAVGVWLTVGGSVALFFLGGQLFVRDDPSWAYINVLVLGVGVTVLQWSRARLRRRWVENRPYLLSANGTVVLRGRRETVTKLSRAALVAALVFVACAFLFLGLASAINCTPGERGFCSEFGRPPEWLVQAWQLLCIAIGAAFVGLMTMRGRLERETERIDLVIAEGQRARRHDHLMDGTDRFSWE